jgi:hypothetical protein
VFVYASDIEWGRRCLFTLLHVRNLILYGPTLSKSRNVMSKGVHYIAFLLTPDISHTDTPETSQE